MKKMLLFFSLIAVSFAYCMEDPLQSDTSVNDYGHTALHIASMNGDTDEVRTRLTNTKINVNNVDNDGFTPLHYAAQSGHQGVSEDGNQAIVELLLKSGANPNAVTSRRHYTPLHFAADNFHTNNVKALLSAGANPNLKVLTQDYYNQPAYVRCIHGTPLHVAAFHGCQEIVELLLKAGATDRRVKTRIPLPVLKSNILKALQPSDSPIQKMTAAEIAKTVGCHALAYFIENWPRYSYTQARLICFAANPSTIAFTVGAVAATGAIMLTKYMRR